jgi:hypothetical protein
MHLEIISEDRIFNYPTTRIHQNYLEHGVHYTFGFSMLLVENVLRINVY